MRLLCWQHDELHTRRPCLQRFTRLFLAMPVHRFCQQAEFHPVAVPVQEHNHHGISSCLQCDHLCQPDCHRIDQCHHQCYCKLHRQLDQQQLKPKRHFQPEHRCQHNQGRSNRCEHHHVQERLKHLGDCDLSVPDPPAVQLPQLWQRHSDELVFMQLLCSQHLLMPCVSHA